MSFSKRLGAYFTTLMAVMMVAFSTACTEINITAPSQVEVATDDTTGAAFEFAPVQNVAAEIGRQEIVQSGWWVKKDSTIDYEHLDFFHSGSSVTGFWISGELEGECPSKRCGYVYQTFSVAIFGEHEDNGQVIVSLRSDPRVRLKFAYYVYRPGSGKGE